ncbi:MAG TPA: PHP domain-containing protein [Candidatus Methylomirabilis sp.]|nr:PHP domain-containing protein [Candidatus Methylomirabilis sp.]
MAGPVDLHTHTTASDGSFTPRELVGEAVRRGLRVLAITDHDSTDGLAPALDEAARHPPLLIVPGIEINCDVEGAEIHILGYYLDYEATWFQEFCRAQREERRARVHRIATRLDELGLPIDPDEVFALVREGSAGRPHVAQAMMRRGYVKSVREAFDKYLAVGRPAHVSRKKLAPDNAVRLIRKASGVPVLAHPGLADRDELIPELIGAGLMGLECYYREHSAAQTAGYAQLCRDHGLVATGGSDFHGPAVRAATLGVPAVSMACWEALRAKAAVARASVPA